MRRRRAFEVYGLEVRLYEVALPLAFLNLGRFRVFRANGRDREARALGRRMEADLANLALAAPDRLFALGPSCNPGDIRSRMRDCPADLLSDAQIDVSDLRAQRHADLRRRLNLAKRRALGATTAPAAGHLALRRLLDGADGGYVL